MDLKALVKGNLLFSTERPVVVATGSIYRQSVSSMNNLQMNSTMHENSAFRSQTSLQYAVGANL